VVYLDVAADLHHQATSLILLEDAPGRADVAHVYIKPQPRPAVTPEHAVPEQAAVRHGHLDAARVPVPADWLPTIFFPQAVVVDEAVAARRAAGLAAAAHDAVPHGPRHAHAGSRHPLDHAVLQQVVRAVQYDRPALREARAVAEDEAAHLDIRDAVFVLPRADAESLGARGGFHDVRVRVRAVGHTESVLRAVSTLNIPTNGPPRWGSGGGRFGPGVSAWSAQAFLRSSTLRAGRSWRQLDITRSARPHSGSSSG